MNTCEIIEKFSSPVFVKLHFQYICLYYSIILHEICTPAKVKKQPFRGAPSQILFKVFAKILKFFFLTVCSYHVTYAFQSESILYSCVNVKELLARNRREIWSLSDCNWTRTHNHLVHKRKLNHLAIPAKWLSCVVSSYLYGPFDCMFLSCHVPVS